MPGSPIGAPGGTTMAQARLNASGLSRKRVMSRASSAACAAARRRSSAARWPCSRAASAASQLQRRDRAHLRHVGRRGQRHQLLRPPRAGPRAQSRLRTGRPARRRPARRRPGRSPRRAPAATDRRRAARPCARRARAGRCWRRCAWRRRPPARSTSNVMPGVAREQLARHAVAVGPRRHALDASPRAARARTA